MPTTADIIIIKGRTPFLTGNRHDCLDSTTGDLNQCHQKKSPSSSHCIPYPMPYPYKINIRPQKRKKRINSIKFIQIHDIPYDIPQYEIIVYVYIYIYPPVI